MTETDKLTYCKFCKNRLFNPKIGLTCNLTNKKPDFKLECNDFNRDNNELKDCRDFSKSYRLIDNTDKKYFPIKLTHNNNDFNIDNTYKFKSVYYKTLWFYIGLASIFVMFSPLIYSRDDIYNKYNLFIAVFGLLGIITNLILLRISKNTLELNKQGVIINDLTINWDKIIRYYLTRENVGDSDEKKWETFLYIDTFGASTPTRLGIMNLNIGFNKLTKILTELNKNYT